MILHQIDFYNFYIILKNSERLSTTVFVKFLKYIMFSDRIKIYEFLCTLKNEEKISHFNNFKHNWIYLFSLILSILQKIYINNS